MLSVCHTFYVHCLLFNSHSSVIEMGFPGGSGVKNLPANAGDEDASSIPGSGRSPGEGNGNPVKCSWNIGKLENPMETGKSHGQRTLLGYSPWVTKETRLRD